MTAIQLSVFSEIGRLKQVVVHNPGPEVDFMVPDMMEHLLFDDILYGDLARQEHGVFRKVLARVADEVLDIQDMPPPDDAAPAPAEAAGGGRGSNVR